MDSFRWIAVALSMILGLSVTQLLNSMIFVFRSRSRMQIHWLPIAWAVCIFIWQLQFWWAILELPALVKVWTLGSFLLMVGLTLLLFVSAALVLPNSSSKPEENLLAYFEGEGRWSLAALSLYFVMALLVDWLFWRESPVSLQGILMLPLIGLPIVFLCSRSRRVHTFVTLLFVVLSVIASIAFSPTAYG